MARDASAIPLALALLCGLGCESQFLQVEVAVEGLGAGSIEVEMRAEGETHQITATEDGGRFPPTLERGTPFELRVVQQPDADLRCAAPMRALLAGDNAVIRCAVTAVCEELGRTRLPRDVEVEEVFPSLERPPHDGEEPRTYSGIARAGDHLYLTSRPGEVYRFEEREDVETMDVVLDLSDRIQVEPGEGLLGLAFHPRFPDSPYVYIQYPSRDMVSVRLSRFTTADGGATFDPDSELVLIDLPKAAPGALDHNGGMVMFGPDGYLWTSFGDGGLAFPPLQTAQETDSLYGTIVRLDVDAAEPYAVPPDNPFVDMPGFAPEIWAYGLRNVFRGAFDRETGALFVGDVGGEIFEEVDRIEPGLNYGWPIREGFECQDGSTGCRSDGLTPPIHAYPHTATYHAVIGGPVYRGTQLDGLTGSLLFADFQTQEIFVARRPYGEVEVETIGNAGAGVLQFLEDARGEILMLGIDGEILRMRAAGDAVPAPERISETGCMHPDDPSAPATGFVPYEVTAPLWSDGADKRRWVFIPDGERASADASGDLRLPVGSALIKEFSRDGERLETRLIVHAEQDRWLAFSYRWRDDGSDADLVRDPIQTDIGGRPWLFPDATQCPTCHTRAAGFALGLDTAQLLGTDGAYEDLADRRMVPDVPAAGVVALAAPSDEAADLELRARSFLHSNCAGCHRPGHPIRPSLDLRFETPLADTNLCQVPEAGDLGIPGAQILAPGDPDASVIVRRLEEVSTRVRMPPLATFEIAPEAALVRQWIGGLASCDP